MGRGVHTINEVESVSIKLIKVSRLRTDPNVAGIIQELKYFINNTGRESIEESDSIAVIPASGKRRSIR